MACTAVSQSGGSTGAGPGWRAGAVVVLGAGRDVGTVRGTGRGTRRV